MKWVFAILIAACPAIALAQEAPSSTAEMVEEQFSGLSVALDPGFAVGVIENGNLVAESYVGMADLESGSAIGPDTRFYIGSISKQFTAALVGQLVLDGRVAMDASVRSYLPELPETYQPVTIADCLFHTGGVREYTSLLLLRGDNPSLEDRMGQSDALKLIRDQRTLDFTPGKEQRYSSSGYVLLAAVLERVTGKPLSVLAQEQLFEPLAMDATLFDDDHAAVVPGRARSYRPTEDGAWRRWLKHFDTVGDGGILTTIRDMAKWDAELTNGSVLGEPLRDWLHQRGRLSDGTVLESAAGLWYGSFRGQASVQHGGGLGSFIADQIRFPNLGMSIYVFANRNDNEAFQAWRLAARLLDARGIRGEEEPPADEVAPADTFYDAWIGAYFLEDRNNRRFVRRNARGQLALHDGADVQTALLKPVGPGRFETVPGGNLIAFGGDDDARTVQLIAPTYRWSGTAFDNASPASLAEIRGHAGRYCSAELETVAYIDVDGEALTLRYAQGNPLVLFPLSDQTNAEWNGINRVWIGTHMIKFRIDEFGQTSGLGMGDNRVSNVEFERC